MNFLSKSESSLDDVNICWAVSMNRNDMSTSSIIIQNNFLYCLNVIIGCWRARATRTSIVIDIFSAFLTPVIPQLNLCSGYSRLAISKVLTHFILFFYTKLIQFLKEWSSHLTTSAADADPLRLLSAFFVSARLLLGKDIGYLAPLFWSAWRSYHLLISRI